MIKKPSKTKSPFLFTATKNNRQFGKAISNKRLPSVETFGYLYVVTGR